MTSNVVDANSSQANSDSDTEFEDVWASMANLYEPQTEELCSFSDVTLIIDNGSHQSVQIKVSSQVLSMASPVFKTMFSEKYAESKQTQTELKDDNPTAMLLLCRLLHHQTVDHEYLQPFDTQNEVMRYSILDFAILADKYDCVKVVTHYADSVLRKQMNGRGMHSWNELAAAAYLLDQPEHFKAFTREMVLWNEVHGESILQERVAANILPSNVLSLLRLQHDTALLEFSKRVSSLIDSASDLPGAIGASDNNYSGTILGALKIANIWPLSLAYQNNIELVLVRLENLRLPAFTTIVSERTGSGWGSTTTSSLHATYHLLDEDGQKCDAPTAHTVEEIRRSIKEICTGVCLDCIKDPPSSQKCRICHTSSATSFGRPVQKEWGVNDSMSRLPAFEGW